VKTGSSACKDLAFQLKKALVVVQEKHGGPESEEPPLVKRYSERTAESLILERLECMEFKRGTSSEVMDGIRKGIPAFFEKFLRRNLLH